METDELQDYRRGAIINKDLQSPAKADGREKHAFYGESFLRWKDLINQIRMERGYGRFNCSMRSGLLGM